MDECIQYFSDEIPAQTERFKSPYHKIVDEEKAKQITSEWRTNGLRMVAVEVVLDIPHYRHSDYLLKSANYGDKLLVRLSSDELIKRAKDPEGTVIEWDERAKHAAHYPYVDLIMPKRENGWGWANDYRPDIIVSSTTSPIFYIRQLIEESSMLLTLGVKLVALDEFAKEIPFERLLEECVLYNTNKLDKDKFSGSIIKERILQRANKHN